MRLRGLDVVIGYSGLGVEAVYLEYHGGRGYCMVRGVGAG